MSEIIISKRCQICKETKPLSEYHKNRTTKDGHRPDCKTCRSKYSKSEKGKIAQKQCRQTKKGKTTQKRYRQSEKGIANQKRYRQNKKGRATRKRYRQNEKSKAIQKLYYQSKKGKIVRKAIQKRYFIHHPEQVEAHKAIMIAVRASKLPRPDTLQCHYCPAQAEQYHHHKGYEPEHWLDVIPTCIKCHKNIHNIATTQ